MNGHSHRVRGLHGYESSSMISSDLESTSFFDSDEDASSRITATTTGMNGVNFKFFFMFCINKYVLKRNLFV